MTNDALIKWAAV